MPKYSDSEEAASEGATPSPEESSPAAEAQNPDAQGEGREDTFFISADHLKAYLDPSTIKAGDVLEFKVVGMDGEGDIEVEYNTGEGEPKQSKMDQMKTDLATHMASAGSEGPGDGGGAGQGY